MVPTDQTERDQAWHDAYTDARADGANHDDAWECADRYVRDNFDKPDCTNCGDMGCPAAHCPAWRANSSAVTADASSNKEVP